mmetsp:Transcript_32976/g.77337  ORF Transcript_32976/g.77337 Transcript_32976/m.77337 type:complete len:391 (-) Transcript_32976:501-1673(-)
MVHRREVAKAHRQPAGLDGDLGVGLRGQRRHDDLAVAAPLFLGQQRDEGLFQRGVCAAQFGRCAGGQHAAGVHGHQPVKGLGLLHVGGGDDDAHGRPLRADAGDQLPELRARQRVHAGGGLVEDQQVGVVDQRAAQAQLLLHAARELAGRPRQKGQQPGAAAELVDAPAPFGRAVAEQAAEELQVLLHRQRRVEVAAQALRHVGDARADALAVGARGHVAAQHLQPPTLQRACAGDQRQQAGLADPVGPDQAQHAAGRQLQRHVGQRLRVAVAQAQGVQAGQRHQSTTFDSAAGQGCWASSRTQATPGSPVLTCSACFFSSSGAIWARTRNISFWRSLAVSTVLGVNCAVLATKDTLAGMTRPGAASSTRRTSLPRASRPATASGTKKLM